MPDGKCDVLDTSFSGMLFVYLPCDGGGGGGDGGGSRALSGHHRTEPRQCFHELKIEQRKLKWVVTGNLAHTHATPIQGTVASVTKDFNMGSRDKTRHGTPRRDTT